jgi:hypothetical protein
LVRPNSPPGPPMPENLTDSPDPTCYLLFSETGIQESQLLAPDLFSSAARTRARDPSGRFAKGHSGNPQGRPPGIANPKRRVIDLRAWQENPQKVRALLDRKPWLLRPLLAQVLPPARAVDPAERLGIRLSSLRTTEDFQQALRKMWGALSLGEIAPADVERIARRVEGVVRRLAHKTDPLRPPLG